MSILIGTLTGIIELEDRLSPQLEQLERRLDVTGARFDDIGTKVRAVGVGFLPLTAAIVGGVYAVTSAATAFESSFAGVRKTVEPIAFTFEELENKFRDLAKTIPISVNEINRIAEAGGQLGVQSRDIVQFTETMAAMGVSTNLSAVEAGEALAQFANIVSNQAGPQFDRLGAAVADLGNKSAATEKMIVEFGLRLAGAGAVAGMSEGQILGIGTALASLGINAEAGSTAFSKVIRRITMAVSEGENAVAGFARVSGLSAKEFTTMWGENAAGALTLFIEGLHRTKISGGNLFGTLKDLNAVEVRLVDSLVRTANAGDLLRKYIDMGSNAFEQNSALVREAQIRYGTFESQVTLVKNRVYDVAITLGDALIPIFKDVITLVTPLIERFGELARWFQELPQPVRATALGIGLLAASIGPVLIGLGTMGIMLGGTVTTLGLVKTGFDIVTKSQIAMAAATWYSNAAGGALSLTMVGLGWIVAAGATGWASYNIALTALDWTGLAERIEYASVKFQRWIGLVDKNATDADIWNSVQANTSNRLKDVAKGLTDADIAARAAGLQIEQLKMQLTGAFDNKRVEDIDKIVTQLRIAGEITPQALQNIGQQLEALDKSGAKLTPQLESMLATFRKTQPSVGPAAKDLDTYRKAVEALRGEISGSKATGDIKKLEDAFRGLTPAQRANKDIVKEVVDKYEDLREKAGSGVSPALEKLYRQTGTLTNQNLDYTEGLMNVTNWTAVYMRASKELEDQLRGLDAQGNLIAYTFGDEVVMGLANATVQTQMMRSEAVSAEDEIDGLAKNFADAFGGAADVLKGINSEFAQMATVVLRAAEAIIDNLAEGDIFGAIVAGAVAAIELLGDALYLGNGERVVRDVGRAWGVALSEEMGNAIAEDAARFGGNLEAAQIFNIDRILGAAGGLTHRNIELFSRKLRDVFVMLERGAFQAADAAEALDGVWREFADFFAGGLISREMKEIIDLAQRMGVESVEMMGFLQDQSARIAEGFSAIATGAIGPLADAIRGLRDAESGDGASENIDQLRALVEQNAITEESFNRLSRLAVASFGAALAAGVPFLEALQQHQDSFNQLNLVAEQFGFTQLAAFGDLSAIAAFFEANEHLAGAIQGTNTMLEALYNSNALTQESFADLGATAVEQFEAMLAGGLTFDQAMLASQDTLQTLWEILQDGTMVVDEATQALIDQAVEAGLVGEAHMDAQERATRAMEQAADAMREVGDVLRQVFGIAGDASEDFVDRTRDALNDIPRVVEFEVRGIYTPPDMPDFGGEQAAGSQGWVNKPTVFIAGEAGPEQFAFSGANRRFGSIGGSDDSVYQEVAGLRRDLKRIMREQPMMFRDQILKAIA